MEIKTLHAIQDEIAKRCGFENLKDTFDVLDAPRIVAICDEAAEAYAYQMCQLQQIECAEHLEVRYDGFEGIDLEYSKASIVNTPNVCNPKTKDDDNDKNS